MRPDPIWKYAVGRRAEPKNFERVLDAAVELFFERGYEAATMQDLADRLGLHKSSLYHYVGSKEELFTRITDAAMGELEASMEEAERKATRQDAVLLALGLATDQAINDMQRVALILRHKPTAPHGAALHERRRAYDNRFASLIELGQQRDTIRRDIPAVLLTRLLLGTVNSIVEWYTPDHSRFAPEDVRRAVVAVAAHGIRGDEGATSDRDQVPVGDG